MMKIIPAIDIIDGKCVRLSKGDYNTKKIYNENPVEVAKEFESLRHSVSSPCGPRWRKIKTYCQSESIGEYRKFNVVAY